MTELRDDLLLYLGLTSVQVLALALVAALLLRALRVSGSPARRVLALVALLPLLWPLAQALPDAGRIEVDVALAAPPAAGATVASPRAPLSVASPTSVRAHSPHAAVAAAPSWRDAVIVVWAGGVLLLLVVAAGGWLRVRRQLRSASRVRDGAVRRLHERCARELGLRRTPRLRVSDACHVPFVAGWLRPTVVVPRGYLTRLPLHELRFALLHELAHVRRGDLFWVVPEHVLRAAYFFHPLLHRVLDRLREERECRCDGDVVRVAGARAPYAAFLLREIHTTSDGSRRGFALALGRRGSASRRVRRLCRREGNTTMRSRIRMHVAVVAVAATLALLLVLGPSRATAEDDPTTLAGGINATPTGEAGVYHVLPVYEEVSRVHAFRRGGPYGREHRRFFEKETEWTFAKETGRLDLKVPVDDQAWMVRVGGVRAMPWSWRTRWPLEPDSVEVRLADRDGVRGVDFEVEEAKGLVHFLRPELCDPKKDYEIRWRHPRDPARPSVARGGSILNKTHWPAKRAPEPVPEPVPVAGPRFRPGAETTNATATEDPRVYVLVRPLLAEDVAVGIGRQGEAGTPRWLAHGREFEYDEKTGAITFVEGLIQDPASVFVTVHGLPRVRDVFHFRRRLEAGSVAVVVGERRLQEGVGFQVDHATGTVTVRDPAIADPKAKFYVKAGERSFGNYDDRALLRRLLEE